MANYKTPGIFIEEVNSLPASVTSVETAIPAFIGYTEFAADKTRSLINIPTKISSLLDYEELFGANPEFETIQVNLNSNLDPVDAELSINYYLYRSLQLFYDNGGSDCYIVSVGLYGDEINLGDPADPENSPGLLPGLDALSKEDQPTLLLSPDSCLLIDNDELASFQQQMLAQCSTLTDRFAVLDLWSGEEGAEEDFRNKLGNNNLKFGAAYHPWLAASLSFEVEYDREIFHITDGDNYYEFHFTESNGVKTAELVHAGEESSQTSAQDDLATLEGADYSEATNPLVYDPIPEYYDPIEYSSLQNAGNTIKDYFDQVSNLFNDLTHEDTIQKFTDLLESYTTDTGQFTLAELMEELFVLDKTYKSVFGNEETAALEVMIQTGSESLTVSKVAAIEDYDLLIPSSESTNNELFSDFLEKKNSDKSQYQNSDGSYSAEAAWDDFCALYDATEELVTELMDPDNEDFLGIMIAYLEEETSGGDTGTITEEEKQVLSGNASWQSIQNTIAKANLILPPSGAMVGVYTKVDQDKGVWKAPANVSLNSVSYTSLKINDKMQENLNVDSTGKSINALRAFSGRGILVWGARTLKASDSEWRYISTRRLFNYVEESLKKSTRWAVFEPNDAKTWVRLKGMINNFLNDLWRQGAFSGSKKEDAYFIKVGKGSTMTEQDILDGKLIIEIGIAAVRPAEFIILRFTHQVSE